MIVLNVEAREPHCPLFKRLLKHVTVAMINTTSRSHCNMSIITEHFPKHFHLFDKEALGTAVPHLSENLPVLKIYNDS